MTTPQIMIKDYQGDDHKCFAAKPFMDQADHMLMTILRGSTSVRTPYVVHTLNLITGEYFDGSYCDDMAQAMQIFNARNR